ncbi:hypothetical protein [Methylobacterium sp. E-066]|uniref:hypothetical protein n=1 Tax=Methylobacterium sp. E-066 TaxID=2836584 RepID=UPI001FB9FAE4|nr:hypothetical protein [Methylobacterium sp. E-066]MCJ2139091.1 hypothetical protein [Methylobacterium sp. E-066]
MASLDQTLQVFRVLLDAEQPVDIGEAEEAIWAYLSSVTGLSAQTAALEMLRRETTALDGVSPFMPRLMDDLGRHKKRLSEKSAA